MFKIYEVPVEQGSHQQETATSTASSSLKPLLDTSSSLKRKRTDDISSSQRDTIPPNKYIRVDHTEQKLDLFYTPHASSSHNLSVEKSLLPFDRCCCSSAAICQMCSPNKPEEDQHVGAFKIHLTSSDLTSVQSKINQISQNKDEFASKIIRQMVYIGRIDRRFSIVQFQARLFIFNHFEAFKEFYYQLCFLQFGEMATWYFDHLIPIRDQLDLCAKFTANGCFTDENQSHGKAFSAEDLVAVLVANREMLEDYFKIEVDSAGNLKSLPQLVPSLSPQLHLLPLFLFRLAANTDWADEATCFENISSHLAELFSNHDWICGTGPLMNSSNRPDQITVLFTLLRKYYLPNNSLRRNNCLIEIASLDSLYKVFERC